MDKDRILVVDDVFANRKILSKILSKNENYEVLIAEDGKSAIEIVSSNKPDIILLDIMMPEMSGFDVIDLLKKNEETINVPVIFITALTEVDNIIKAFKSGGVDYVTKPFNTEELLARVSTHLRLKKLQDELKSKNHMLEDREVHLEALVKEKTEKLENTTISLVTALENANFYNDNDTGNHIKRVSEYSAILATAYGCDRDFVKRIKMFASLHDVGKVGISDALLKKPARYTPEEFEAMKEHVVIGERILKTTEIDGMAKNIALYHHEKWDGSGYVSGLKGEDIPLEARIVALADVFDALVSERPYKKPFPLEKAKEIIREGAGAHFDPKLVDLFFENIEKFLVINNKLK